jgi:succinyl-diaminopimelate desuccinylase
MLDTLLAELDDSYTIRLLKEMIAIDSVVGKEKDFAEFLRNEFEALGLKFQMHEVEPGRPNIYAWLKGDKQDKRLNYNGHLDTVPVVDGWDTDPFKPITKDNKIYGLGACDMKAGIACTLNMLKAFVESNYVLNGELSFSGVIDEEAYGKGAKAMLQTKLKSVDAIVLAEPYPGDETKPIPLGITGKILYDIHVRGLAAHGFRPHLGINAIEQAAKILTNLDKLNFKENPNFGTGNYSTLMIEGGYEIYSVVVPASCRFEVNRLIVPGETVQIAIEDMERLVSSLDLDVDVEVKIKPPRYEAYTMNGEEEIIKVFDGVYRDVMSRKPLYEYANGITDANIFSGEGGIPCLHLGPQRGGAHQKNEYVHLDWLPLISKMFTLIAVRFFD